MKAIHNILIGIIGMFGIFSCEEFVAIDPPNSQVVSSVVYETDALAFAAMDGVYHRLFAFDNFSGGALHSVSYIGGLCADELDTYNILGYPQLVEFEENDIVVDNQTNLFLWSSAYNTIYNANAVLEGIVASVSLSADTKRQLEGEAKFVRAFAHFYLVQLFGEVPLILTTDYDENASAPQNEPTAVYEQIIKDLKDSQSLLDAEYRGGTKTNANRLAATALLSRVYMYLEDWTTAETLAGEVIAATDLYGMNTNLNEVFLANSNEAIWQITPVGTTGMTNEGSNFILTSPNNFITPVGLSQHLLTAFETGDLRQTNWVAYLEDATDRYYYAYKYKISFTTDAPTEFSTVLRLAEQYLIRAEARTRMGNSTGALADVNVIRSRAGLADLQNTSESELLSAILQERRVEFFTEWGHRWFDLKRTGNSGTVLGSIKPGWSDTDLLFPIPEQELLRAPQLAQNPGY